MVAFGKRMGGGRRSAARAAAPLVATIMTRTGSRSAILVDASSTGARLRGIDLPPVGEEVMVNLGGINLFGEIAWSDDAERGVGFDSPLSAQEENWLRAKIKEGRGLPAELKAAFDDWTLSVAR